MAASFSGAMLVNPVVVVGSSQLLAFGLDETILLRFAFVLYGCDEIGEFFQPQKWVLVCLTGAVGIVYRATGSNYKLHVVCSIDTHVSFIAI